MAIQPGPIDARHALACCRFLTLALGLILVLGGRPAHADTAEGLEAMKRGNYIRALIDFEEPAKAGDPVAQANLGAIYHYGLGVAADFGQAARWYHAAAVQGNIDGELGLAVLYTTGQGLPPDFAIAHMWLSIAADGMPPTPDRLRVEQDRDALAKRMAPEELQRSDALVKAWYSRHQAP